MSPDARARHNARQFGFPELLERCLDVVAEREGDLRGGRVRRLRQLVKIEAVAAAGI
jgi:hypothetical protein